MVMSTLCEPIKIHQEHFKVIYGTIDLWAQKWSKDLLKDLNERECSLNNNKKWSK